MPVEIKGQQLRIRIRSPKRATSFRTQDVGRKGKLQRVAAYYPEKGWQTQSWRLNLDDYPSKKEAIRDVKRLRISPALKRRALRILK